MAKPTAWGQSLPIACPSVPCQQPLVGTGQTHWPTSSSSSRRFGFAYLVWRSCARRRLAVASLVAAASVHVPTAQHLVVHTAAAMKFAIAAASARAPNQVCKSKAAGAPARMGQHVRAHSLELRHGALVTATLRPVPRGLYTPHQSRHVSLAGQPPPATLLCLRSARCSGVRGAGQPAPQC